MLDPRIPSKVKVSCFTYAITESDKPIREGYVGRAIHDELSILLDSNRPGDLQCSTLWHEIIHAVDKMLNLGFDEATVSRLEAGLYQVLRENRLHFDEVPTDA